MAALQGMNTCELTEMEQNVIQFNSIQFYLYSAKS